MKVPVDSIGQVICSSRASGKKLPAFLVRIFHHSSSSSSLILSYSMEGSASDWKRARVRAFRGDAGAKTRPLPAPSFASNGCSMYVDGVWLAHRDLSLWMCECMCRISWRNGCGTGREQQQGCDWLGRCDRGHLAAFRWKSGMRTAEYSFLCRPSVRINSDWKQYAHSLRAIAR